jgi:hypothetical protein
MTISFTSVLGAEAVIINNPYQLVAYGESSLMQQTGGTEALSQCTSANPSIFLNPNQQFDPGPYNGAQFVVAEAEAFPDVFKAKNLAQTQSDSGPPFHADYPPDLDQKIPGFYYETETGFFDGSSFPTSQGLNIAGSASNGTRVYFQFTGIPAGMKLFVPVITLLTQSSAPTNATGIAALTATDANGAGPYTPVAGNSYGWAPVPITGTTGMASYEILDASPATQETLTISVAAAYLANQVGTGTINVHSGLAPLSTVQVADDISPIPRFAANGTIAPAFTIQACHQGATSTTTATGATAAYSPTSQTVLLNATVSTASGTVSGGTVTFSMAGTNLAPVAVIDGLATATFTFSGLAAASYNIYAEYSGFENVAGSSDNSKLLVITKAMPAIGWFPTSMVQGTPLGPQQLNAVCVPGTFVYQPPAGTILPLGDQKLSVLFYPANTADYSPTGLTAYIDVLPPSLPFGSFDTPAASSNVSGSLGFTGWAISPYGITKVDIWREDAGTLVYIGDGSFTAGSRPDVQKLYANYPESNSAGWGYLMLTNELPGGNGTFQIHAIAHDFNNAGTDLGTKTIVVDNADATQPFGSIDTPTQGGMESGTFVNFGWALTPPGKTIPTDGSTVWVFIDNQRIGHPAYNNYRVDIATLFPGYANSQGAVGYYYIDTTQLSNGLHTISWSVTDSAGVASGIGSRYFTVQN